MFVTVLAMVQEFKEAKNITKGDIVTLVKEPENIHDKNAIAVYLDKKKVGYLGNSSKKGTVLEGTNSATEINEKIKDATRARIVKLESDDNWAIKFKAELLLEVKKKNETELPFTIRGGHATHPGKQKLTQDTQTAPRTIRIVSYDGTLVAQYENQISGRIHGDKEVMKIIEEQVEDLGEVLAETVSVDKMTINSVLKLTSVRVVKKTDIKSEVKRIIDEKINTKEELDEKLEYLKRAKVPNVAILNLLKSYIKYPEGIEKRIPGKPKVVYIDTASIVDDAVSFMNTGTHLRFEGEKGVGKNVLTETLAWLYNRPFYEFSSNSQHSNNSLLGGQTFENREDEPEEEKETTGSFVNLVKMIKKVLFKGDKADIDENELSGVQKFISQFLGKDDKKLVFEKSSILEAFEYGGILVLDEFNTSLPHVMSILNGVLDDRRRIEVTNLGKVDGHVNFSAISTQNKDYEGTFETNDATSDRFQPILFPTMKSISGILQERVPNASYEAVSACDKLYLSMKSAVDSQQMDEQVISIRGFISACEVMDQGKDLKDALIKGIAHRVDDEESREAIINMIDLQIG